MELNSLINYNRYDLDSVVAFTAPAFIPVEAMFFCNTYTVSAIIKGDRPLLAKKRALTNSMDLGRQTSVVFVMKDPRRHKVQRHRVCMACAGRLSMG